MIRRLRQVFNTNNALEHLGCLIILCRWRHNTRAVDEVDAAHQGDVLPDLGFTGDGSHIADLLLLEGVDNGRLADVGVANEADRDLLAVREEGGELSE